MRGKKAKQMKRLARLYASQTGVSVDKLYKQAKEMHMSMTQDDYKKKVK